jgi:hypothetical protein
MTYESYADLINRYLAGPAALERAVAGMSREQALSRPITGKWSTLEVVAHLADFEPVYVDRMKRIVSHDKPTLLGADENLFAKTLAYHARDLDEELKLISVTRSAMGKVLKALPPEAWSRVGVHTEAGEYTLAKMLDRITGHIDHHLPFIAEKRRAMGI